MPYHIENGERIRLAKQIGHGGEGDVYLLDDKPNVVAKIYHSPLPSAREHKLRNMLTLSSSTLSSISAWPLNLIKKKNTAEIHGILLPFADGFELHTVYGPTERKQTLPDVGLDFLLQTARNLSAVFDTVHKHNVVVGDVNEKNFIVDKRAIVRIIDCDSFQIPSRSGTPFLCTVGVEHYTPQELQGTDLSKVQRTKNHDCFGLAVLIFQLLFMARHPFAVASKDHRLLSLPFGESIKKFLYAYGRSAISLGIFPSPMTLPTTILPQPLLDLFDAAFTPASVYSRPSAAFWGAELDKTSKHIVTCRYDKSHKYCNHLNACPWCDFSQRNGLHFFVSYAVFSAYDLSTGDISAFRASLASIHKIDLTPKDAASYGIGMPSGRPIAFSAKLPALSFYFGFLVIAIALVVMFKAPFAFFAVFWGGYLIYNGRHRKAYTEEKRNRKSRYDSCSQHAGALYAKLEDVAKAYGSLFTQKRDAALKDIENYSKLPDEKTRGLQELDNKRKQFQLDKYLERFLISKSKIRDIGSARTMTLVSYGIETAADVNYSNIQRVPGFGSHLSTVLLAWRKSYENRFVFDPRQPVPKSEIDSLSKRINDKKLSLQDSIAKGIKSLAELNARTLSQRTDIENQLPSALRKLKTAEADFSVFK